MVRHIGPGTEGRGVHSSRSWETTGICERQTGGGTARRQGGRGLEVGETTTARGVLCTMTERLRRLRKRQPRAHSRVVSAHGGVVAWRDRGGEEIVTNSCVSAVTGVVDVLCRTQLAEVLNAGRRMTTSRWLPTRMDGRVLTTVWWVSPQCSWTSRGRCACRAAWK